MKEDGEGMDLKKEVFDWISSIAWAIIIALFIKFFIFNTTVVRGSSMFPTLEENDRLLAQKVTLYFKSPEKGQIIVLEAPDDDKKDYIKRVIAVEGDTVSIINGEVYVNEEKLNENYIEENSYTDTYDTNHWVVGDGEVFVLGDNREPGASKDSRYFGTIPVDSVKGITGFRFYPFNEKFGTLK